jgi:hypothetical protein
MPGRKRSAGLVRFNSQLVMVHSPSEVVADGAKCAGIGSWERFFSSQGDTAKGVRNGNLGYRRQHELVVDLD